MMPVYGFVAGDTIGLLVLCREDELVSELAAKMQNASRLRVAPRSAVDVVHRDLVLDPTWTLGRAGIRALDRVDLVEKVR